MREELEQTAAEEKKKGRNSEAKAEALVNKIIPFSLVDGPGNRTAIFFQGCNFDCLYCHNPETINLCNNCGKCVPGCPTAALEIAAGRVTWQEELCVDCGQYLEVCVRDSSPRVKKMGLTTFLDTNGSILLEEKDKLLEYLDKAMIDAKSFKAAEHQRLTGCSNDTVRENIKFMAGIDKLYEVRTVIVPEVLANLDRV